MVAKSRHFLVAKSRHFLVATLPVAVLHAVGACVEDDELMGGRLGWDDDHDRHLVVQYKLTRSACLHVHDLVGVE